MAPQVPVAVFRGRTSTERSPRSISGVSGYAWAISSRPRRMMRRPVRMTSAEGTAIVTG